MSGSGEASTGGALPIPPWPPVGGAGPLVPPAPLEAMEFPWSGDPEARLVVSPLELTDFTGRPLLSADGRIIAANGLVSPGEDGHVWRWDVEQGSVEQIGRSGSTALLAISSDGSSVLGTDDNGDFLWRTGEIEPLPFDRAPWDCQPQLSRDGESVVGCLNRQTVMLRAGGETIAVDELPPGTNHSMPLAINSDGSAIGGVAYQWEPGDGDARNPQPFFWTAEAGLRAIQLPSNVHTARVVAVSDDGQRAVLVARTGTGKEPAQALLRWSEEGKVEFIGPSATLLANAELSAIVAESGEFVYRWTEDEGLSFFPKRLDSLAIGSLMQASADGTRVLGRALTTVNGIAPPPPFLIDLKLGWVSEEAAFPEAHRAGFTHVASSSISDDGRYIAGIALRETGESRVFRLDMHR